MEEKSVTIQIQAPYFTLGTAHEHTSQVWIACHGYGQMAKFFGRRFDVLDPETNLLLLPQGLSRFYLDGQYKHVGASWMTKERREFDIAAQMHYLDTMYATETATLKPGRFRLNLLGFSQGATAICRWAVHRKAKLHKLIIWAGSLPAEQTAEHWQFLDAQTQIYLVVGNNDEYFTGDRIERWFEQSAKVLPKPKLIRFDGAHELNREVLMPLVK